MSYDLPKHVMVGDASFEVRYDYRVILEIFEAINDPELDDYSRTIAVLQMFYVDFYSLRDFEEAIKACFWFINGGKEESENRKAVKLVDWEQDFPCIVAPINRVLGYEVRGIPYDLEHNTGGVHWWTFLSAYMEIGDCLFAQVVHIREMRRKGKPLDKSDREFYKRNRDLVDMKTKYTEHEDNLVKRWTGG